MNNKNSLFYEFTSQPPKERILVLDRDGVLNVDSGYTCRLEDLIVNGQIVDLINKIKVNTFTLAVCTNQSGIGRGFFSKQQMEIFNYNLRENLYSLCHTTFDYLIACPHIQSNNCDCRKPKPGMLIEMAKRLKVTQSKMFFIGNTESDYLASLNANVKYGDINSPELLENLDKWFNQ